MNDAAAADRRALLVLFGLTGATVVRISNGAMNRQRICNRQQQSANRQGIGNSSASSWRREKPAHEERAGVGPAWAVLGRA